MENRNLFVLLVIIAVLAPAIYYFVSGRNYDHTSIRSILVVFQFLGGLALLYFFAFKTKKKS